MPSGLSITTKANLLSGKYIFSYYSPVSRLVTFFGFTIHAYPPGPITAYRTLILGPIVSSG